LLGTGKRQTHQSSLALVPLDAGSMSTGLGREDGGCAHQGHRNAARGTGRLQTLQFFFSRLLNMSAPSSPAGNALN
jgi:hypothetical protein